MFVFFFFKQKTAYEMRISDWSSDVCSSDLCIAERRAKEPLRAWWHFEKLIILLLDPGFRLTEALHCNRSFVKRKRWFDVEGNAHEGIWKIGRASCRERVCQYV